MQNMKSMKGYRFSQYITVLAVMAFLTTANVATAGTLAITSTPDGAVAADQAYTYTVQVNGHTEGTALSYSLTNEPEGMSISSDGVVTWKPTKAGIYRFVVGAADSLGNYASKPIRLSVLPGELSSLRIEPDQKPTSITLGTTQTFSVKGSDKEGNATTIERVSWSSAGDIGTVTAAGVFTPTRNGTGKVSAQIGALSATVDVSVVGQAPQTQPLAPKGTVLGTTTDQPTTDTNSADTNTSATSTTPAPAEQSGACVNWRHWIILSMIIVYGAALIWYFQFTKRRSNPLWWLFPVLLTVIGLIIYAKYICEGTYTWWPWVLLAIGVILTFLYKPKGSIQE